MRTADWLGWVDSSWACALAVEVGIDQGAVVVVGPA